MRAKEYFDAVLSEIKEVKTTQTQQALVQVKQQAILDEHIRRSEANEKNLETTQDILNLLKDEFSNHSRDAVKWSVLGKILTYSGVGVGLFTGVLKLLGKI
jgi:FKBP-type peptidyl-prolyl cis-trans isomerase (trigger factor)